MDNLYVRELYLEKIREYYDSTGIIKILTGVKGCGKSCILEMIIDELRSQSVPNENIIEINLDKRPYKGIKNSEQLLKAIADKTRGLEGTRYLFIDNISHVKDYEDAMNICYEDGRYSVFITASNRYILRPEHVKKLIAHYIEYEIYTLTFSEYLDMKKFYDKKISRNHQEEFIKYMMEGSFPKVVRYDLLDGQHSYAKGVLEDIYEQEVRHNKRIKNKEMFDAIKEYIVRNFATTISIKDMQESLHRRLGVSIRKETLYNYLGVLEDVYIVNKCSRVDIGDKRFLKGKERYYLSDLSFYYAIDMYNTLDYETSLQNVVYNYAKANDYTVGVGKIGSLQVDFIMQDVNMDYLYVQVVRYINNKVDENWEHPEEDIEYEPLEKIHDYYPKYIMSLDKLLRKRSGIKHRNVFEFMENGQMF